MSWWSPARDSASLVVVFLETDWRFAMHQITRGVVVVGFLAVALHAVPLALSQPAEPVKSDAAELKELQKERIETLTGLVDLVLRQLQSGRTDFTHVVRAQMDLVDAKLDSAENPRERMVLLEEQLKMAQSILDDVKRRADIGSPTTTGAEVLQAKALCLDIKIKLVRERVKLKAQGT
jgi:hypothetical protein